MEDAQRIHFVMSGTNSPFGALNRIGGDKHQMYEVFEVRKLTDGEMKNLGDAPL